jgi:hypothetical protein
MIVTYLTNGSPEIHLDVLKAICGDVSSKRAIDICAGFAPQTRQLGFADITYVDIVSRDLGTESHRFVNKDVFEYIRRNGDIGNRWDVSIILDGIEHFTKDKARLLLNYMEIFSNKQIVFTPIGEYKIGTDEHPDTHKSGWMPNEFEDLGYSVIVFPNFHHTINLGAFFAFKCKNMLEEVQRIIKELNNKEWVKSNL